MKREQKNFFESLMFFPGRVERAMNFRKEQKGPEEHGGELPDMKQEYEDKPLSEKMEKGDLPAMLISAFIVLVPVALVAVLVMVFLSRLLLNVL